MVNESPIATFASARAVLLLHGQSPSLGSESEAIPPVLLRFDSGYRAASFPTAGLQSSLEGLRAVNRV